MRLSSVLCALANLLLLSRADIAVPVNSHWYGGFQANACFDITVELHGWKITLTFDQPITSLEVWVADVVQKLEGGKVFVLTNKFFNRDEHVGNILCVDFQGHGNGDIIPKVRAKIESADGTVIEPTNAPQTARPIHIHAPTTAKPSTPVHTHAPTTSKPTEPQETHAPKTSKPTVPQETHAPTTSKPTVPQETHAPTTSKPTEPQETHAPTTSKPPVPQETHAPTTSKPPVPQETHAPTTIKPPPPEQTQAPTVAWPLYLPSGTDWTSSMKVNNPHSDGFEGVFNFPLTENVVGWLANITYNVDVTNMQIYDGEVVSHSPDGRNWIVVNKMSKSVYKPGNMELKFNAMFTGGGSPSGQAVLINMGHDDWTVREAPNMDKSKYNYNDVLYKSILFYEAQRSGKLPANNRIPWRGDSALNDKGDNGEDLTGGWYDAGDHVKFNFPMAYATTALAWSYIEYSNAYRESDQASHFLDSIRWSLDYLLKCHTGPEELYVQVGDAGQDHGYWGAPEKMTMPRPAYKITASKPGSDVAMETAAAMAAGYLVFKDYDLTYADKLLEHAKQLWEFGNKYHGKYSDSVPAAAGFYNSNNFTDELAWGSLWLHRATKDDKYLAEAEKQFDPDPAWGQSWDEKTIGNQILLYKATNKTNYKTAITNSFLGWLPGGKVPYTPKGLAFRLQWGSLRYSSNMAMAALIAADAGIMPDELRRWAMCQIHYVLGDTGFSYVIGFGSKYPLRPHHRSSSCPMQPALCGSDVMQSSAPNVHTLYGAMVGGPGQVDDYTDDRGNYVNNEVACDYNAGLQGAVAGLKHLIITGEHPEKKGNAKCPYS